MKLRLPPISDDYYRYCVKKSQVIIAHSRGYTLPLEEKRDILQAENNKVAYEAFQKRYLNKKGQLELSSLDMVYEKPGFTSLEVYFCMGEDLMLELTRRAVFAQEKKKVKVFKRNIIFVCDGFSELKQALNTELEVEILLFQQLYIDPRIHIYSSTHEKLKPEEKKSLFGTEAMKGLTTSLISAQKDPLSIFLNLEANDVIRLKQDNVYCGHEKATIAYRIAS